MQSDRARRIGRHAVLWLAAAAVLVWRDPLKPLATPNPCAAGLDVFAIFVARQWPALPVGRLLSTLDTVILIAALACFAEWCYLAAKNVLIAGAATVALGLGPALAPSLAPPASAAALGLCAAFALVTRGRLLGPVASGRSAVRAFVVLALASTVVPSWCIACSACAIAVGWRTFAPMPRAPRLAVTLGAAIAVGGAALLVSRYAGVPTLARGVPWYACAFSADVAGQWLAQSASIVWWLLGPVVLALAALGTFAIASRRGAAPIVVVLVLVAIAAIPSSNGRPEIVWQALITAVWSACAIGLTECAAMMGPTRARFAASALLLIAVPALELTRVRGQERDNVVRPIGHERATLAEVTAILNVIPADARLVDEDASIDLLLRAASFGGRRASKPFSMVEPTRQAVARALTGGPVYAFPRGQEILSLRGFVVEPAVDRFRDVGLQQIHGLGAIAAARRCVQLSEAWVDLTSVAATGRIAIAAESEPARGPVLLYFAGPTEYAPGPDGWAPRVRTGFDVTLLDRETPDRAARFSAEMREAGLENTAVAHERYASRLIVRRTPLSPLELAIVLGPPRPAAIGRLATDSAGSPSITICDAPNVTITSF